MIPLKPCHLQQRCPKIGCFQENLLSLPAHDCKFVCYEPPPDQLFMSRIIMDFNLERPQPFLSALCLYIFSEQKPLHLPFVMHCCTNRHSKMVVFRLKGWQKQCSIFTSAWIDFCGAFFLKHTSFFLIPLVNFVIFWSLEQGEIAMSTFLFCFRDDEETPVKEEFALSKQETPMQHQAILRERRLAKQKHDLVVVLDQTSSHDQSHDNSESEINVHILCQSIN